ncbi:peroxisomal membrane protein PEX14-like isoform X1 [Amphibalanus amphitrite]|uniref:peroxisomal membrane protein PEX14-like isoform X1 n=1 Tax=Amphibalanus amphitrite TaxID=1232801 RepID=UPI001C90394B|nr:peroxisomal membrane protein PEX14-like isoform X1 [Amphibalanus amphitrite]
MSESPAAAAAAVAPREQMVVAAARFLNNPRVAGSSEQQKLAFLRQKGLTEEEINEAVLRSPAVAYSLHSTQTCAFLGIRQSPRFLGALQAVCNVIVVFFGGGYIIYYIVKTYVLPWLTGSRRRPSSAERLDALQASLDASVRQLSDSLRALQTQLGDQQRSLDQLRPAAADQTQLQRELGQLRAEVASLKGLMLNRHQFAAAPSPPPAPSIPSWQMVKPAPAEAADKTKADSSSSGDIVIVSGNNSDASDQHSDS